MRANRVEARKLIIMIIDVLAPVARRAAGEQRRHRPALNRRRALHPGIVEEGRRIVDILDRRRDARARADMPRILDQERRAHRFFIRSEEHTSELQSLMRISYAVFCLNKKNTKTK